MSLVTPHPANPVDLVALGEVMLRFDPGESRIRSARSFQVWEGGGEYNVARGLRKCFRLRTAICTALADNDIGRLVEDMILQGGVDTRWIKWAPYDGIGRSVRNGLNFVERGFGVRPALGVSDRGHTAVSQLKLGDFDWNAIFSESGVRWFHTGGIFTALGDGTAALALEAVQAATRFGASVSFDLNYRPSLWNSLADPDQVRALNREIAAQADVLFGDPGSALSCLGLETPPSITKHPGDTSSGNSDCFEGFCSAVCDRFPNLKGVGMTYRAIHSPTRNELQGFLWWDGRSAASRHLTDLQVLDRIGSGDAFAAGAIYGLLSNTGQQRAVDLATAHAALAMTTPGDNSMASLEEVEALADGGLARVRR